MGKRLTVMRMLRSRLASEKAFLKHVPMHNDCAEVYGSQPFPDQAVVNATRDVEQLEFLIEKLTEYQQANPTIQDWQNKSTK